MNAPPAGPRPTNIMPTVRRPVRLPTRTCTVRPLVLANGEGGEEAEPVSLEGEEDEEEENEEGEEDEDEDGERLELPSVEVPDMMDDEVCVCSCVCAFVRVRMCVV